MDSKNEEAGDNCGPLSNPDGGHRTSRVPSPPQPARDPAFDCCCHDACNGIVGSEQCNASTAYYLDTGGQSNEYLCGNRMASHMDGDTDRDNGSDRDDCDNAAADTRA